MLDGLPLFEQPRFDGTTYDHARDGERLTAQLTEVRELMADGQWRTLGEIAAHCQAPEASVSARLRDLRKRRHGLRTVERKYVGDGLWAYRLVP